MAVNQGELVRPRSTGEILDDAFRLVLVDGAVLLAVAGLFTAPAAVALLLTLTLAAPTTGLGQCLLPGILALTLPLTGLAAAACQEAFRCRADGRPPLPGTCLRGACRRGLHHAAARAVVLALSLPCLLGLLLPLYFFSDQPAILVLFYVGLIVFLLPLGWAVLTATATAHPILATGELGWSAALAAAMQEAQRNFTKAALVTISRFLILALVVVNMFLLLHTGLWVGSDLTGFELSYPTLLLTATNPVLVLALVLLGWLVLTPFTEAANYLLHVDARARYEGLDLWYRAQRLLPAIPKGRIGTFLLAAGVAVGAAGRAHAEDRLDTVREVRQQLQQLLQDVQTANPYPGSRNWQRELGTLGERLEGSATTRPEGFRWFRQAVQTFPVSDRGAAVQALADLNSRLALVEENLAHRRPDRAGPNRSKSTVKSLLQPLDEPTAPVKPPPAPPAKTEKKPPPDRIEEPRVPRERGPGLVSPIGGAGFGAVLWVLLAGLLAAVVVVAARLWWLNRSPRQTKAPARVEVEDHSLEEIVTRADQHPVESLWRQADELARAGRLLEAVRTLYLAVLALLHRSNMIRFERTRTNGEYIDQLRSRPTLQQPFRGLTVFFERKWYGERACQEADFSACRDLAEEVRQVCLSE